MINEGGNGMPPFADLLTKAEKDDIVAYSEELCKFVRTCSSCPQAVPIV